MPGTVIDGRPQYLSQGLILFVDLGDLVETGQFDAGNTQALFHILGSQARFRVEDDVDVGLGHGLIGGKVGTAGNLIDLIKADASQDVVQLAVVLQGREIAQEIDRPAAARLFSSSE